MGSAYLLPLVERAPLITLEAIGLKRLSELYELDPDEVVKRMDERNVPLNSGDAFLAVVVSPSDP